MQLVNFEGSHTCVLRPVLPSKAKKRIEASLVPQVRGFGVPLVSGVPRRAPIVSGSFRL